jgi:predicted RNase H-like nuclease/AcrR family transcriptional regulator
MQPARRPLDRDRVVTEAVALADEAGLAALSMRTLAGRLGVEAMSLYHHVPGKEALLDAMVDGVVGELHLPVVGGDWRTELRERSVSGRAVLLRHPWAVGLMASRRTPGPQQASHQDAVLGCLAAQGFSPVAAGTASALVDAHLYGSVLREVGLPVADDFAVTLELVLGALEGLRSVETKARASGAATVTAPAPLEVSVPVLGVDGCPGGWVGAVLVPGAPRPRVVVAPTIGLLVETVRADVDIQVVGIDIPIGLPDNAIRQADVLARRSLRGRASSVFTTLTRSAYLAPDRAAADAVNRGLSGQGVGAQAFALRSKILEVDAWLRTRPTVDVVEVHPEVSFTAMTGAPLPGKRTDEGRRARLDALAAAGVNGPSVLKGSGYAADDVLDACAAAWSAHRRATGDARWLPDPPEVFSDGIRAAIVV